MTMQSTSRNGKNNSTTILPIASGRLLRVRRTLQETLAIEPRLLPEESKDAMRALEAAWQQVNEQIASGEMNLIEWLDEALQECHQARLWVAPILLRRLRQLQGGDLTCRSNDGALASVPRFFGLPQDFVACCLFMGWKSLRVVRRLGAGFEFLDRNDATSFVEGIARCWQCRPESRVRGHVEQHLAESGWKLR